MRDSQNREQYTVNEKWCGSKEHGIYGQLFLPADLSEGQKVPLVLFCHELYRTHSSGIPYAKELATMGIAVYTFDFRGASKESRSPGSMLKMSVMTCKSDLMEVYEEALRWPFTDSERIAVIGASQGAFASAVAAAQYPDAFRCLVLMYGAYVIMDDVRNLYPERELVPDPFDYNGWSLMGACYLTDLWDFDPVVLGTYKGPVLLLHGDDDPLVDPSYSERIAGLYENSEYYLISGGRHGFRKSAFTEAMRLIKDFFLNNGMKNEKI